MGSWIAEKIGYAIGWGFGHLFRFLGIENFWLGCLAVVVAPIALFIVLVAVIGPLVGVLLFLLILAAAIAGVVYLKVRGRNSGSGSSLAPSGGPISESDTAVTIGDISGVYRSFLDLLQEDEDQDPVRLASDLRAMCQEAGLSGARLEEAMMVIWRLWAAVGYTVFIEDPRLRELLKQLGSQLALQNVPLGQYIDHFDQWMAWLSEAYNGNPQEIPGGRARTNAPLLPDETPISVEDAEYVTENGIRLDSGTIAITDRHVYYSGSRGGQYDFRTRYDEIVSLDLHVYAWDTWDKVAPTIILVRVGHESSPDILKLPDAPGPSYNDYLNMSHVRSIISCMMDRPDSPANPQRLS